MAEVFLRPLLATEHTDFDAGAERVAFAMAKRCAVPLHGVLPFVSNPEFEVAAPHLAAKAEAEAGERADAVEAAAAAAGVDFHLQVRSGAELYEEIVDEAGEMQADLIVIRRRGKRGFLAKMLVGEIVSKVISHAPCSVLVVARLAQPWQRRVLVALDPHAASPAVLAQAESAARACALPLHVLAVAADEGGRAQAQAMVDIAARDAAQQGVPVSAEVRVAAKASDAIIEAATAVGADLIVVGRHGGDSSRHAWIGGTTQKVIGTAECPVLVHITNAPNVKS